MDGLEWIHAMEGIMRVSLVRLLSVSFRVLSLVELGVGNGPWNDGVAGLEELECCCIPLNCIVIPRMDQCCIASLLVCYL